MRVPFIAAWASPKADHVNQRRLPIAAGEIQPQIASVCDLYPTISKLAKTEPVKSHQIDGSLLDTLLMGKRDSGRSETFLMHYPHAPHRTDYFTVYREGSWKVIYHYFPSSVSEGSNYQLFNLAEDPFEQNNLATRNPVELGRMMKNLIAALESQEAVYPRKPDGSDLRPKMP